MTKQKNITSSNLTYNKTSKLFTVEIIICGELKFYDTYDLYEASALKRGEKEKELFKDINIFQVSNE